MLILTSTTDAMGSLAALFEALRDDPRMNEGEGIVAIGRPEPAVPGAQYAHVKVGYDRGRSPFGENRTFVVHTAALNPDTGLSLGSGTYDLTREEAWAKVSGRKPATA